MFLIFYWSDLCTITCVALGNLSWSISKNQISNLTSSDVFMIIRSACVPIENMKHSSPQFCWLLIKFIIPKVNKFWGNGSICFYMCVFHPHLFKYRWPIKKTDRIRLHTLYPTCKFKQSGFWLFMWIKLVDKWTEQLILSHVKDGDKLGIHEPPFCDTFIACRCRQGFSELLNVVIKLCGRAILGRGCGRWSCPFKF